MSNASLHSSILDQLAEREGLVGRDLRFLRCLSWEKIDIEVAQRFFSRINETGVKIDPASLEAAIVGGHVIDHQTGGADPMWAVNDLNRLLRDAADAEAYREPVSNLLQASGLSPALIKRAVTVLINAGQNGLALRLALARWLDRPEVLNSLGAELKKYKEDLEPASFLVTGFSTLNIFSDDFSKACAVHGVNAQIQTTDYGQAIQSLLNTADSSYNGVLIVLDRDGLLPVDWRHSGGDIEQLILERVTQLAEAIHSFSDKTGIPILVNTLPRPVSPSFGVIDNTAPGGEGRIVNRVNSILYDLAESLANVLLVDSDMALADIPASARIDDKLFYYGRIPFSNQASRLLASAFSSTFVSLKTGPAKVLALDLDNTMWGGIYGEDGVANLQCDEEFPGNVFRAFQQECLRLKNQGMLLVVLSKNNPDAISVFDEHQGMILKKKDFVAHRINWDLKAQNIRELAEELNLGLQSFIFLDDSSHERSAMRAMCPEVIVPELPDDPSHWVRFLRGLRETWVLRMTDEDRRRSEMYIADRQRKDLKKVSRSIEEYLLSLHQSLTLIRVDDNCLKRIAQLHLRTNQFNLTTERLDAAAISKMRQQDDKFVMLAGRVVDKFGDHGIVITGIAEVDGDVATIRTFLMSCRVIGRNVEDAFLCALIDELVGRGVKRIMGIFRPTSKNQQVAEFYPKHGFSSEKALEDGKCWELGIDNGSAKPVCPAGIEILKEWDDGNSTCKVQVSH
ncbi:HAD-IIIC family phosphatase [Thiohalobacter sp. IOR34]|uniref:HAD-IIIC family phosphatase n=1 Tax=Thiohalobacter sp. IOR34 TaxID=3057176 RepID=UPI0025B05D97|nr:HAD-IIIC family phosphatase [Thiohalobacter sp. IOR34]WJW76708.1 HAD-IIIC family phosphatase [Thiohalobacter sp. IOR34]